jgi:hypothetical protein
VNAFSWDCEAKNRQRALFASKIIAEMRMAILTICFLFLVSIATAQETRLTDPETYKAYENMIIKYLEDGNFDALEEQFKNVKDRSVEFQDGSPKVWAYYMAFDFGDPFKRKTLDDTKTVVQQVRSWRDKRPNSVAAPLALVEALIGQANKIRETAKEQRVDITNNPAFKQSLFETLEEAALIIFSAEKGVPNIQAQPEYYAEVVALKYQLGDNTWHDVQRAVTDGVFIEPTYVPLYLETLIWLATRPAEIQATLPKPIDWITEILKVEADDDPEIADQKARTYAQTISFTQASIIDAQQADWSTLKRGLALLVHSYPDSTEWATRYLVVSYAMKDLEATKEALNILQGNYSPMVIADPALFQEASAWVEEQSRSPTP